MLPCYTPPQEDGLYLLVGEVVKGLEDPARRKGAAAAITVFCRGSRLDFQEHVPTLITVCMASRVASPPVSGVGCACHQ